MQFITLFAQIIQMTHNFLQEHHNNIRTTKVGRYQKGKTNLDLLEQEIASGSGIS